MSIAKLIVVRRKRRSWRVRNKTKRVSSGRHRLSVFRSNKHISAQIIDDLSGNTVVSASSCEKSVRIVCGRCGNVAAARVIGKLIGERCVQLGVVDVFFDRGKYKYHGRVAEVAKAAREAGLCF